MVGGWSKDGAVQDQIDASIEYVVEAARSQLPIGASLTHCEECGTTIPEARRKAVAGMRLCFICQPNWTNHRQNLAATTDAAVRTVN